MINIFLIGDSIRFGAYGDDGYGMYVSEKLQGTANVYEPAENSRWAQYTLRYLHEWADKVPKNEIAIVHWNNGLWDVLRLLGDEPLTDIESYGIMLRRVYQRIRLLFPNAKVIFALSTAVIEEWGKPHFFRYNSEIEQYNRKAIEVLEPLGVYINDLYSVTKDFDSSLHSDWVHFKIEGAKILADKVVEACLKNEN